MDSTCWLRTFPALRAAAIVVLCILATACSPGPGGGGGGSNNNSAPGDTEWGDIAGAEPVNLQVENGTRVSAIVSAAAGGTLTATGWTTMSLQLPAGALPADTEVSLTLASDPSARFAAAAVLEPDGLVLNAPATLTITLPAALGPNQKLTLVEADANDLRDFAATGLLAEVSEDGTTIRVPVDHFSAAGAYVNCHGHSLRRIIQALTAPTDQGGQGLTKQQVLDEIRYTVGDVWVERKTDWDDTDYQLAVSKAWTDLEAKFDLLRTNDTRVTADDRELMAFLNTFYAPADVSLDPVLQDGRLQIDSAGNAVVSSTKEACLQKVAALAGRRHHLPPIFNLGESLPISQHPNSSVTILNGVAHSFPVMLRDDGPVIEQGLNITAVQSDRLQQAREAFRRDHPEEWSARGMTMPPRGVAVMPLTSLDRFRSQPTGAAVNDEYAYWGGEENLVTQSTTKFPWVAARMWVPRGEYVDLCKDCVSDDECDDGQFCNGAETCANELCQPGMDPCRGDPCDEAAEECQGADNGNDNTPADPNQVVTFADPCLEDQVRTQLNQPSGDLTAEKLATLTALTRDRSSIRSLSGIEYCTNLTYLSLIANEIDDLTPLSHLTKLEQLVLSGNNIQDVSPLADIASLEVLYLSDNRISDVSSLVGLSSLVVLDLSRQAGGLADLSPLANLTALTELSLASNGISDIGSLAGLTELWKLILYWNDVTDVSPLQGLPKLQNLWLDDNPIDDFGPLAANSRIGAGDYIVLTCCPGLLDCDTGTADATQCGYKDQMEARGANVVYGSRETCGTPAPVLGLDKGPCVLYGAE